MTVDGGATWVLIKQLPIAAPGSDCEEVSVSLAEFANQTVLIKFQQFDNNPAPTDGFTLEFVAIENGCEVDADCEDGLFCNGKETCLPGDPNADPLTGCVDGSEACTSPCVCDESDDVCVCGCPAVPCPEPLECQVVGCLDGSCLYSPADAGTPCGDDGVACTLDACDGAGNCVHTPTDGLCLPDANACTDTICHPVVGCIHVPDDTNTCDDGLYCTVGDHCDGGSCVGSPRDCNDGVGCTEDACDEIADTCVHSPAGGGCPISNSPCFSYECDVNNGCVIVYHNGVACDDGNFCTDDWCENGTCLHASINCDNGQFCDGVETCSPILGCRPGTPTNCDDEIPCTNDQCVAATDQCTHTPNDAHCGTSYSPCISNFCDPVNGCSRRVDHDGAACSDGLACSSNDHCEGGLCVGSPRVCNDGVSCPPGPSSPPGCTTNGTGTGIDTVTSSAQVGDKVCFTVSIFNTCPSCCDVAGVITTLFIGDPDGPGGVPAAVAYPITTGAYLERGADFICPSADPRCVTAGNCTIPGVIGYQYIVADEDEHGESGDSCPPTPEAGPGQVSAYTQGTGTVCRAIQVAASLCKAIAIDVLYCGDNIADHNICSNDGSTPCTTDANCALDGHCVHETCDGTDATGCSLTCRAPGAVNECTCCGDGLLQASSGEQCDTNVFKAGAPAVHGNCRTNCTFCGDGIVNGGEECDDGNGTNHDGCSATCLIEECAVEVDKQVSCDGQNWFDVDLVANNDDGTFGPVPGCFFNDPVYVRYQVSNVGEVNVNNCTLSESNSLIVPGGTVSTGGSIGFGVTLNPTTADGNQDCTDSLTEQEPNTATLICDCGQPGLPLSIVQASDSATVECVPICGDNLVDRTEETCDGTNAAGCSDSCRGPGTLAECTCCGDGIRNGSETCDDGNAVNTDGCRNDCTKCGDGVVDAGEACDDGNTNDNDGCGNNCTNGCGNGILNTGEDCDGTAFEAGAPATHGTCRADCTYCGNSTMDGGESCDDGNEVNTDACRNNCTLPFCGDSILDAGEDCDGTAFEAGAPTAHGVCRADCTYCGNGKMDGSETCDDGNDVNADGCRNDCTFCGDGHVDAGEECDDGNAVRDDGCSLDCFFECCAQISWGGPFAIASSGANWSDTANWWPPRLPNLGDNVVITGNGIVVELDISVVVHVLRIGDGVTIRATGDGLSFQGTIKSKGTLDVPADSSLLIRKPSVAEGITIDGGTIRFAGEQRLTFEDGVTLQDVRIERRQDNINDPLEVLTFITLELSGAIDNEAVISLIDDTTLLPVQGLDSSRVSLTGAGQIQMNAPISILGDPNGDAELVNGDAHTILGVGTIVGPLTNEGLIKAEGGMLSIAAPGEKINTGIMEARDGGVLRIQQDLTGSGKLQAFGGIIEAGTPFIEASDVVLGPGGTYQRDPAFAARNPSLECESIAVLGAQSPADKPGTLLLDESMSASVQGDVVFFGSFPNGDCPGQEYIDSIAGGPTPPIRGIRGTSQLSVGANIYLGSLAVASGSKRFAGGNSEFEGNVAFACSSTEPISLGGDFMNYSTRPDCFQYLNGAIVLNGVDEQVFEVAGRDLGSSPEDCRDNFVFGSVTVASSSNVRFVDLFLNQPLSGLSGDLNGDGIVNLTDHAEFGPCLTMSGPGRSPAAGECGQHFDSDGDGDVDLRDVYWFQQNFLLASEALYVRSLVLEANSIVTIDNCRVYYGRLVDHGAKVTTSGYGQLLQLNIPSIISTVPPHGAVDAGRPDLSGSDPVGWLSVVFEFDRDMSGRLPQDFKIATSHGEAPIPTDAFTQGNKVTLMLDRPIPAGAWTRITHGCNPTVCLGSLPGDVNGDGVTGPSDILDLIDNLNGAHVLPLALHQCDLDRSGQCAPADILSEIDLLNGAGAFDEWNGRSIGECPP